MDYTQVFESYEALSAHLQETESQYVRSVPYVNFGKAVFGCRRFLPDSGLGSMDPGSLEYLAAVEAATPSSSLVVWMKFGKELTEIPTTFGTLAELNSVALVDPPLVTYRVSGIPAAVDYKDAGSGVSRTYTVDLSGYRKTDRGLTNDAMQQYRDIDWRFLIGVKDASSLQFPTPRRIAVARPGV